MRINNNLQALNTHRQLGVNTTAGAKSMEKLSSGFRINRAGDDAAGLSISEKMRGQIRGLNQASQNAQDGISLIQTAEGALNESHAIIQRMRELTVQAGNGTNEADELKAIQAEIAELNKELGAEDGKGIVNRTEFNGMKLLDGSLAKGDGGKSVTLQIGANAGQQIDINIENMGADALGSEDLKLSAIDVAAEDFDFDATVEALDSALEQVSTQRSNLGANQNRLEHTIRNLDTSSENLQASESRIRDVDMAKEMMEQTKANILQQASTAMLAQANQAPQSVLRLLG